MNEIKTRNYAEVTISDLRKLGLYGNVTAKIDTGEIFKLKPKYATTTKKAIVANEIEEVEIIEDYPNIFRKIQTIQRNNLLIAKRINKGEKEFLKLTGKGFKKQ